MPISKAASTIFAASTAVAAGTLKSSPVVGSSVDCRSCYGGELTYKITNNAGTFTAACIIVFQVSHDGANWYDYYPVYGDTAASSVNSGALLLDRPVMYVRAIAFGVTGSGASSTVEASVQNVTGV
jgi:hypothetical protein